MDNCPTCGQSLYDSEVPTLLNIEDKWWTLDGLERGERVRLPDSNLTVEMVVPPAEREYNSYGESWSEDIFMVLKVDDRYYRKDGYRGSFGGTTWEGECREVKGEPRTITVFDYVEDN